MGRFGGFFLWIAELSSKSAQLLPYSCRPPKLKVGNYQCISGSKSGSTCFWTSWIRIWIHQSEVWIRIPIPIRIWIFLSPSKKVRKTLIPTALLLLFEFLSLKTMYMYLQKVISKKNFLKNQLFVGILKRAMTKIAGSGSASGSGSISQRHGSTDPDPDPPQNVKDPQHWLLHRFGRELLQNFELHLKNQDQNKKN